jgi:hypothetical protein
MNKLVLYILTVIFALTILLSGCGGGSNNNTNQPTPTPPAYVGKWDGVSQTGNTEFNFRAVMKLPTLPILSPV